jgi:mono/diheme cytochrome c family protein
MSAASFALVRALVLGRGRRLLVLLAGPLVSLTACRESPDEPWPPTGQELYVRHCASCHGISGKGDGPVAPSLNRPTPDLTTLARQGRFDEANLMAIIDGRRVVPIHGPREMPVWGAVFSAGHEEEPYQEYTTLLHTETLVEYLRTIQEEP